MPATRRHSDDTRPMRSSGTGQSPARTNGAGANGFSPALDRIPPQALEMEQAVIGCMMVDPTRGSVEAVRALLCPGDFYRDGHRRIYEAILRLDDAGSPTDMLSVQDDLERAGFLDLAGGMPYLMACGELVPSVTRAGAYAERVAETARLRTLIDVGGQLVGAAYEQQEPPEALAGRFMSLLDAQATPRARRGADPAAAALAQGVSVAKLLSLPEREIRWVVPDLISEGLSILMGGPKLGKSFLALDIAWAVATGGVALGKKPVEQGRVLCLSLEDTAGRLQRRWRTRLDGAEPPENLILVNPWPRLRDGGLLRLDRWLLANPDTRLVIVDTLAMVRDAQDPKGQLYYQDYGDVRAIKDVADDHRCGLLLIHHTRKAASEDWMERSSGSQGTQAPADASLILERKRGSADGTLRLTGRDVEDQSYAMRWDKIAGWELLGEAGEVARTEEEFAVLDKLVEAGCALTVKELADRLAIGGGACKSRAYRMVSRGMLHVDRGWFRPTTEGMVFWNQKHPDAEKCTS